MSKRKRKREREEAAPATAASPLAEPPSPRRLLPVDVQQKEFRLAFRGYNEQDVDEFLDSVTEELARLHEENKRLMERLEEGGGAGPSAGMLIEDAQRRAEDIVREARAQASALLAGGGAPPAPEGAPAAAAAEDLRPFLVREREFLQGLASLIQQHAASVKRDAQQVRGPASAESSPEPAGTATGVSTAEADSESRPSGAYAPRHASALASQAPVPETPETSEPIPAVAPDPVGAGRDAWGPEPQDDPWAEGTGAEPAGFDAPAAAAATTPPAPSPEPFEAPPPFEAPAGPESQGGDVDETRRWSAPAASDWEEAVELPLKEEAGFASEVQAPDPSEARDEPDRPVEESPFGPERGGEASWSDPFLETGGPGPAPAAGPQGTLEDEFSPDPISLTAPPRAAEREDDATAPEHTDAPRDESDETGREESDRSLRELFWGEE